MFFIPFDAVLCRSFLCVSERRERERAFFVSCFERMQKKKKEKEKGGTGCRLFLSFFFLSIFQKVCLPRPLSLFVLLNREIALKKYLLKK